MPTAAVAQGPETVSVGAGTVPVGILAGKWAVLSDPVTPDRPTLAPCGAGRWRQEMGVHGTLHVSSSWVALHRPL